MPGPKTNEREGTRAVLRHARMSPSKVREVLDLVRNRPVHEAEDILRFSERDAAFTVGKLLRSAVANAEHNDGLDPEELYVSACFADEGTTIKRWRPRARGRATRIRKRTTHITVIVSRLPQASLERLRARRQAEQLAQRARRVAGARASEGDTRSRSERRRGAPVEEPEVDQEVRTVEATESDSALRAAQADEEGIVDTTASGLAAVQAGEIIETTEDKAGHGAVAATGAGRLEAAEEEAGIVDTTAGAVAANEAESNAEHGEKPEPSSQAEPTDKTEEPADKTEEPADKTEEPADKTEEKDS